MDKMKETVKPSMDRTRRQLIIGAGLTPLVVTLHSAKVFGQDLTVGSASGAAPFSGVIEGSLGPDGQTPGNASTEVALYNLIASGNHPEIGNYYGNIGRIESGSIESGYLTWQYYEGGMGDNTPRTWTRDYETPYVENVEAYIAICKKIQDATDAISGNNIDGVTFPSSADVLNAELIPLPDGADENVGCFKLVNEAKSYWNLETLVTNYNNAVDAYNGQHSEDSAFVAIPRLN